MSWCCSELSKIILKEDKNQINEVSVIKVTEVREKRKKMTKTEKVAECVCLSKLKRRYWFNSFALRNRDVRDFLSWCCNEQSKILMIRVELMMFLSQGNL